uniref:Pupal cuticle protein Edg-78E n=1 Tax=Glossina brevipalpis TaxID=37001 RepID=A0A1A9X534_9MUSC
MLLIKYTNNIKIILAMLCMLSCCKASEIVNSRSIDKNAETLYYNNQPPNKNGEYYYEFQTTNGITTKAAGNPYGTSGVNQYISLEGIPITLTYVADSNGYHPTGDHIPKVPDYVIKALEYIATHPPANERNSHSRR